MPRSAATPPTARRLRAVLELLTVDELKQRLALAEPGHKRLRKPDLVAALESHLAGEALWQLWERLDESQRLAATVASGWC